LIWAVVPVKDFDAAKQRLHAVLAPGERRALAQAMLADVLTTLRRVGGLDRILLVTREPHAMALAQSFGCAVLTEPANCGQTSAVRRALEEARRHQAHAVLTVPADVPLVAPADVEAILTAGAEAEVVLVPSRDHRGTNAVWLRSSADFPLRFGADSFRLHWDAARERKMRTVILELPRLALDVDVAEDLMELARRYTEDPELALGSHTARLMEQMLWRARFR
jgi:2-phospho-L-lactate guanylyltransferase